MMKPLLPLPKPLTPGIALLNGDVTPHYRARATAENHRAWFAASARAAGGGVQETDGVSWTRTLEEVIIPFPRLTDADTGATLDRILTVCRANGVTKASCWATRPIRPPHLGASLLARGFEWGWRPHWMVVDLHDLRSDFPAPDGLEISVDEDGLGEVPGLPYHGPGDAAKVLALNAQTPRRTWHFVARLEGRVVGHSLIYISTGPLGIAGIYNVGVVPDARRQGIGKAITAAACQYARALGCRYAGLNSAADGIYLALGFVSCGWGQSWWMHSHALSQPAPTPEQIVLVEAIGSGDLIALESLPDSAVPGDWDAPLPCGLSPMGVAVATGQRAAMSWLETHGAMLGVLHAWDSGQKRRVPELLARTPELANRRSGPMGMTPLHEAVYRNDRRLVRMLLKADPDLTLRDTQFHATALGWAQHFRNDAMIALLGGETVPPASAV